MKTILLVDDEYFFRQSLKKNVPWEEYGFAVIGEANNGADALKIVCERQPDVVFLDINMPVLNGLQFCEELQKRELFPKIVILSGYEEFEYVKQALRYGVRDYLLKPIDFGEMKQTLQTLQSELTSEGLDADDTSRSEADLRSELLDLLEDEYQTPDACRVALVTLGMSDPKKHLYCIFIAIDGVESGRLGSGTHRILALLDEVYASTEHGFGFSRNMVKGIVAFSENESAGLSEQLSLLLERVNRLGCGECTVGVSASFSCLDALASFAAQATEAVCNRLLRGKRNVYRYDELAAENGETGLRLSDNAKLHLQRAVLAQDPQGMQQSIANVFQTLLQNKACFSCLNNTCIDMVSFVLKTKYTNYAEDYTRALMKIGSSLRCMEQMESFFELQNWFIKFILALVNAWNTGVVELAPMRSEKIKLFVLENLARPEMNVDFISKAFFISYHYLCVMFKKEIGITLNEYITNERIQKAKYLFDTGAVSVSLAASSVGFQDPNYFSRAFKKHIGVSPSSYITSKCASDCTSDSDGR